VLPFLVKLYLENKIIIKVILDIPPQVCRRKA